ncbi:MAG: GNAT family N-acetyltransferase [Blastocatellales bacterium]
MSIQNVNDVVIRTATNHDRERVVALVFGVLTEYGLPPDPESKDADLNDIEENYIKPGGVFELIEDKAGTLLGTFGLCPLDKDTCELRKMYFVPQVRGMGLGRRVLERAVGHARRLGFKTIVLETNSVLKEAIRLYTRFGFTPEPVEHATERCDQAYILKLAEGEE